MGDLFVQTSRATGKTARRPGHFLLACAKTHSPKSETFVYNNAQSLEDRLYPRAHHALYSGKAGPSTKTAW